MEQAHGEYKIAIEIADEKLKSPKVENKEKRQSTITDLTSDQGLASEIASNPS